MKISGITKITLEPDYILEEYDLTPEEANVGLKYVLAAGSSVMLNQKNIVRARSIYIELYSLTPDMKPLTRNQTIVFEIAKPPSLATLRDMVTKYPYFSWYALTKFYTLTDDGSSYSNEIWDMVTGTDYAMQQEHVIKNLETIHGIWKQLEKRSKATKPNGSTIDLGNKQMLLLDIAKVAYEEIDFLTIKHEMALNKPRVWVLGKEEEVDKVVSQMHSYDNSGMYMISRVAASVKNILSNIGPGLCSVKNVSKGNVSENMVPWIEKLANQTIILSGSPQYVGYLPAELQSRSAEFMELILAKGRLISAADTGIIAVQLAPDDILGNILPQIVKSMFGTTEIYLSIINIA